VGRTGPKPNSRCSPSPPPHKRGKGKRREKKPQNTVGFCRVSRAPSLLLLLKEKKRKVGGIGGKENRKTPATTAANVSPGEKRKGEGRDTTAPSGKHNHKEVCDVFVFERKRHEGFVSGHLVYREKERGGGKGEGKENYRAKRPSSQHLHEKKKKKGGGKEQPRILSHIFRGRERGQKQPLILLFLPKRRRGHQKRGGELVHKLCPKKGRGKEKKTVSLSLRPLREVKQLSPNLLSLHSFQEGGMKRGRTTSRIDPF